MNLNQIYYKECENISQQKFFTKCGEIFYSFHAVAKSTAEPGNSNYLHTANSSTPLNRAFFVRSLRTPKESAVKFDYIFPTYEITKSKIGFCKFLSMVACSGKGFALCCVPYVAVFQPVTRYHPKPGNFSVVTSSKFHTELSAMIYLFKAVNRSDLRNTAKHYSAFPKYTVRINADTLAQARAKIAPFFVVLGVVYA
ncbi:Ash family protein [Pasteurella langaaensis DSM 22999]|uniref:Ash family protein n=1 Tax=Alitibacter langaaensis DSM 22999 TaxID=1122935 RepID=A0A2U0SMR5_9PAST|nr:ash family protein [Pasteurella langaaensis]PVX32645.1 Ash family protein [Pasteurella langaaensis DSM 22999]